VQQVVRELANVVVECGGEQQRLPLIRQHFENTPHVVDEAHVEHAVGFVEDEYLDVGQVNRALLHVIEQPAGRRDDDVGAAAQLVLLRIDADAAEDRQRTIRQVPAVDGDALLDLRRELARRRQDQNAWVLVTRRARQLQALQDRQRETGGLAGAGLSAGEDVAPFEHDGNGLLLNRRGFAIALFIDGTQQFGRQAEVFE
jgi:hypothetical protein